jgi:hypothetical protein
MTLAELRDYLAEMTKQAHASNVGPNAESIAARMWKHFTPAALSLWTPAGVLEHIAACLTPPDADDEEDDRANDDF